MKIRTTLSAALALCHLPFAISHAADYSAKSASTTTSNTIVVAWPGTAYPLRLVTVGATSDKAASTLTWRIGGAPTTLANAALAAATNLTCYAGSLASNDVVLLQNASGLVTQKTVWGRSASTNARARFDLVLGTNLAAADTIAGLDPATYSLGYAAASNATTLFLDRTNGIDVSSNLVLRTANDLWKATVTNAAETTTYAVTVRNPLSANLSAGDAAYTVSTTSTNIAATIAANATDLHVRGTNGFTDGDVVRITASSGTWVVRTISTVTTTNIALTVAVGTALSANDLVSKIENATTLVLPALTGDKTLYLAASNGIAVNARLVLAPVGGTPFGAVATAAASSSTAYVATLTEGTPQGYPVGTTLYLLTNLYTLQQPSTAAEYEATLDSDSGLTAGDLVAIMPATGGTFLNIFRESAARILDTVTLTGAAGIALYTGDNLYLSTSVSEPVGAATIHWSGEALFVAPQGRPATLSLDCATNASLHNVVGHQ